MRGEPLNKTTLDDNESLIPVEQDLVRHRNDLAGLVQKSGPGFIRRIGRISVQKFNSVAGDP